MLDRFYSIGPFSGSHPGGAGHPRTMLRVYVDPTSIGINGSRRHIIECECGATQKALPYANGRKRRR